MLVLCYPGHCPQHSWYNASMCAFCSCFHPHNMACSQQSMAANVIYATALNAECHRQQRQRLRQTFSCKGGSPVIPLYINEKGIWALRDMGCQGPTLKHPNYVDEQNYTGDHILLKVAFDGPNESYKVSLAILNLRTPSLLCDSNVPVTVDVWPLVEFQCILGNSLFQDHSKFSDIFTNP